MGKMSARAKFITKEIKRLTKDLNHPWQKSPEWRQRLESRIAALRAEMEASDGGSH